MATDKECKCIKRALGSVMFASSLENNAMLASKGEIKLREDVVLEDGTKIRNINDLKDLILMPHHGQEHL